MRKKEQKAVEVRSKCGYCGAVFVNGENGLSIGQAITQHWYSANCPKHVPRDADSKLRTDWWLKWRYPQILSEMKSKKPMSEETKEALRQYREEHAEEIKARKKIRARAKALLRPGRTRGRRIKER